MEDKDLQEQVGEVEGEVKDVVEEVEQDVNSVSDEISQDPASEVIPKVTEKVELNWKSVANKLRTIHASLEKDFTINAYFIKQKIDELRKRFNSKERTPQLHADITALKVPESVTEEPKTDTEEI